MLLPISITQYFTQPPPPSLALNGSLMTCITSYKYVGVQITSDLMWTDHIVKICNNRKLIGMLHQSFYKHSNSSTMPTLYSYSYSTATRIRYCCMGSILDIELLEGVQKFGLRVCNKSWNCSYDELLKLPTLQTRCQQSKLCQHYKIVNGKIYTDAPIHTR